MQIFVRTYISVLTNKCKYNMGMEFRNQINTDNGKCNNLVLIIIYTNQLSIKIAI